MRKLFNVFIAFILIICFLAGCSETPSTNSIEATDNNIEETISISTEITKDTDVVQSYVIRKEITLDFSFGQRTGLYTGTVNEYGIPDGFGVFSTQNEEGIAWEYSGSWEKGHWNHIGATVWSNGQEYSGYYENDVSTGFGTYTIGDYVYSGHMDNMALTGYGTIYTADGAFFGFFNGDGNGTGTMYYYDGHTEELNFDGDSFTPVQRENDAPTTVENSTEVNTVETQVVSRPKDFLEDEERQEICRELYLSFKFSELADMLNSYISEYSPEKSDSVYSILDEITPLLEYEDKWVATIDDFNGEVILSFPGADRISETNTIQFYNTGSKCAVYVGFEKNDWLFFDQTELSADGNVVDTSNYKSYDVNTDVISGGKIKEFANGRFLDSTLLELKDAKKVIMRFTNTKTGEKLERQLSQSEIDALYCSAKITLVIRNLGNLIFRYNHPES